MKMRNKPFQRILIICEGITEQLYAKELKNTIPRALQRSIDIDIFYDQESNPRNLVERALQKKKKAKKEGNAYDEIWIFFDNDNCDSLEKLFHIINKENFKIAYSSICIEHWFILHFQDCGRPFSTGADALKHLKSLWKDYHKTKLPHYSVLKERLPLALERCRILKQNAENNNDLLHQKNPYFTIEELINKFETLGKVF